MADEDTLLEEAMDNLKEAGGRIRGTQSLLRSEGMADGENHHDDHEGEGEDHHDHTKLHKKRVSFSEHPPAFQWRVLLPAHVKYSYPRPGDEQR
jgi:hypothetical protein